MAESEVATLQRYLRMTRYGADRIINDPVSTAHQFGKALEFLHTVYQPIVRAQDRSLFAYEAFIRTRHSTLTDPIQLLTAAELLGRTKELGRAVRQCVATTLDRHPERLEPIFLSLHPSDLDSSILCTAHDPLYRFASRVVFEVTERSAFFQPGGLAEELAALRSTGYRIALDDLGEGYAGLSWLAQLQPEVAKIDMSLVRDIHESKLKREIVRSLVAVCRRSRITLVADGVETLQEAQVLCDLGCDLLQGNFFARPGPAFPELGKP
jgi:EAL domain-containing protein (putative c-di-GMP-specific phosphodiesterase class I)